MNLRPNQLVAHLERTLAPVYTIHGDEPLLAMEAGDDIRAAARKAGCDEREVLVAEKGFDWDAFRATDANLGLFRVAQAHRFAHSIGQARHRRREGARSLAASVA
jgi:DNA polymerase-3 subunit delta